MRIWVGSSPTISMCARWYTGCSMIHLHLKGSQIWLLNKFCYWPTKWRRKNVQSTCNSLIPSWATDWVPWLNRVKEMVLLLNGLHRFLLSSNWILEQSTGRRQCFMTTTCKIRPSWMYTNSSKLARIRKLGTWHGILPTTQILRLICSYNEFSKIRLVSRTKKFTHLSMYKRWSRLSTFLKNKKLINRSSWKFDSCMGPSPLKILLNCYSVVK